MSNESHHVYTIERCDWTVDAGWRAFCDCGWQSRIYEDPFEAEYDADDHIAETESAE